MQPGLFEVDFNFHFVLLSLTQGAESWEPEWEKRITQKLFWLFEMQSFSISDG